MSSTVGSLTKTGWKRRAKRRVLLHVLAVLVEGRRTDAVQLAAGERGLEQVRGIHGAIGLAGADEGVHLVDEQDDAAFGRGHFAEHAFQALLELAAILRTGDQRAHVEGEQLLVLQALRHVAVDDAQREAFDDGGLADAGLADQHRVVLGAARENLDRAADLLVAADHRVELAVAGGLGEVARIFLQRIIGVLRRRVVGGAALAQGIDGGVEPLGRHAGLGQDLAGFRVLLDGECQQHALDGDEGIARLLGGFLGGVEEAHQLARRLRLRGRAGHFRLLGEPLLDGGMRVAGAAAGPVDQAGAQAFRIVEQDFQDMARSELRVAFAHGKVLRRLHEAPGTLGIFFKIHSHPSSEPPALLEAQADPAMSDPHGEASVSIGPKSGRHFWDQSDAYLSLRIVGRGTGGPRQRKPVPTFPHDALELTWCIPFATTRGGTGFPCSH